MNSRGDVMKELMRQYVEPYLPTDEQRHAGYLALRAAAKEQSSQSNSGNDPVTYGLQDAMKGEASDHKDGSTEDE